MTPLPKRPRTVPVTPQAVTTTHRGFILGSLRQSAGAGDRNTLPRAREEGSDCSRLDPARPLLSAVHSSTAADATGNPGDHAAHAVLDLARVHRRRSERDGECDRAQRSRRGLASTAISVPALNHTWLDLPGDDFQRGADELFDLSTDHLSDIGDIQIISIQASGDDAWCLAGFDLIVNDQSGSGFNPA